MKRNSGFTLVEIMIVVAIIGLLTSIAIPAFIQYRNDARAGLCMSNLRLISHAKENYAIKYSLDTGSPVNATDINIYLGDGTDTSGPACPSAGSYTYNAIDTLPTCTYAGTDATHVYTGQVN
jgi:prepilin-type N-terminal cleavage/methylation domain-containing protein